MTILGRFEGQIALKTQKFCDFRIDRQKLRRKAYFHLDRRKKIFLTQKMARIWPNLGKNFFFRIFAQKWLFVLLWGLSEHFGKFQGDWGRNKCQIKFFS